MIYLPFIFFSILSVFHIRKSKKLDIGAFLMLLYAFSSAMSILLYSSPYLYYRYTKLDLSATIYYCLMLILFFVPFLAKEHSRKLNVIKPNMAFFYLVSFSFIILNLFAIIFSLKYTIFVLSNNPGSFKVGADIMMRKLGYNLNFLESASHYILGHFSDFYVLILVIFFYSVTFLKRNNLFNILLLVSSMSTIINGLNTGGRTQMIYWVLVFIACFLYFYKYMSNKTRRYILSLFFFFILLFSVYFAAVTIYRFSHYYSTTVVHQEVMSIIDYAGQSYLNFNRIFSQFDEHHYTLARIFPITRDIFINPDFDIRDYRYLLTVDIAIFYTFLGDLYVDIGILGTCIYAMLFLILYYLTQLGKRSDFIHFHQIVFIFLFLQIPLNGIFYYSLWNKTATISIIGTIVISFIFMILKKRTNG